jgi:succinate dehydrogenase / fumarate reductase cytochrome b subunit
MTQADRPLSPHLQIYRPQLTSVLSILHRLTGVALALGTGLLVWWLAAAAAGPEAFAVATGFLGSIFGRLVLLGWSFALFYHLCNGIRHLFWDAGYGYEITTLNRSGWLVLVSSLALTVIAWLAAYAARGGS